MSLKIPFMPVVDAIASMRADMVSNSGPLFLRPQELQAQPVRLKGQRVQHFDACARVLVEIAARLVEELAGQRHVAFVEIVDLAHVRDVRDAGAVHGSNEAGRHPLKTARAVLTASRVRSSQAGAGPRSGRLFVDLVHAHFERKRGPVGNRSGGPQRIADRVEHAAEAPEVLNDERFLVLARGTRALNDPL